ncbi:MAG: hypothetical protein KatS3mg125_1370 [Lysobacterales bacterium]|nr:MAG: hypothetical protein KatS3mg125_1370 [Xanthomonadales bacterium]
MYGLWATFLILSGAGIAAAGLAGYLIFAPLAWRHLREKYPEKIPTKTFISHRFFAWIITSKWRSFGDTGLVGLAAPARWLGIAFLFGSLLAAAALGLGAN